MREGSRTSGWLFLTPNLITRMRARKMLNMWYEGSANMPVIHSKIFIGIPVSNTLLPPRKGILIGWRNGGKNDTWLHSFFVVITEYLRVHNTWDLETGKSKSVVPASAEGIMPHCNMAEGITWLWQASKLAPVSPPHLVLSLNYHHVVSLSWPDVIPSTSQKPHLQIMLMFDCRD